MFSRIILRRSFGRAPRSTREVDYVFNPVVFNRINENLVIAGKEKAVGYWLAGISSSIFFMVCVGGYTRLTKSGLSMVRWEPNRLLPPSTQEQWEKEFEEYKKSPEWIQVNSKKGMDVNGFKYIFFWEWFHRIVGRSIGFTFFIPLTYFWGRGYLKTRLKATLCSLFLLGGVQGAIGWWMVKSGLVDKKETKELDKAPRVSPYRLATHAGFAYSLYAVCFWQCCNLLRRPQEAIINSIDKMGANNQHRKTLHRYAKVVLPFVLVTGFFTAGTNAGASCNTFPWVGSHWFYNSNHFVEGIPLWKNFTENKLIC